MKQIHSQMDLEEIENLMLDTKEAIEYQNVNRKKKYYFLFLIYILI